jgi:hypothetical protein
VGGVVGGIAGLTFIALVAYFLLRRQRRGSRRAELVHEMPYAQNEQNEQKYEMESPPVEMPADHDLTSKPNLAPSYVHELEVQNDAKDQNFKQKPVSYA